MRIPVDQYFTRIRFVQPVQDVHQRGLAGAVFAQQGVDFSLAQVEIYLVIGQHTRELFGDAFCFKDNWCFSHVVLLLLVRYAVSGWRSGLADQRRSG